MKEIRTMRIIKLISINICMVLLATTIFSGFASAANSPPPTPGAPQGPTTGQTLHLLYFTSTSVIDPDGDNVYYMFDWGDGSQSGWIGPYPPEDSASDSHGWSNPGTYLVKAKAKDVYDAESDWSPALTVTIPNQLSPTPYAPTGPTTGITLHSASYVMRVAISTNADYRFDWDASGAHNYSVWSQQLSSSHVWSTPGVYMVKAQAKNSIGAESDWSPALTVTITPNHPPAAPNAPTGPTNTQVTLPYTYSTQSVADPDGDPVYYQFDWNASGTHEYSDWIYYYNTPQINISHIWYHVGVYTVKVKAKDSVGTETDWSVGLSVTTQPYVTVDGPTEGHVGTTYTFTAAGYANNSSAIQYFLDWGDGNTSGWLGPYTSGQLVSATYSWSTRGTYQVKVKAKDYYGAESSWSQTLPVVITGQPAETPLEIVVASSVLAKHSFIITVTADDVAVALASVTFNGETQTTDSSGQVTFTAPETTGSYLVLASKSGYQSASEMVTVLSTGENTQEGLLYGLITDDAKKPLSGVSICAINAETGTTVKCVATDAKGDYMISIPMGSYTIIANKQGYEPSTKLNQNVQLNLAIEVNFRLSQKQEAPTDDTTKSFIEDAISTKIQLGEIGAKANVVSSEEHTISSYIEGLNLDVNSAEETVRFTVSAPNGTQGTILVFHIGEGVLSDLNNVILTYDNASITEENDVAAFFDMHNSTDPAWLRVATNSGLYIFVLVPHFSTHTITISSIPKQILQYTGFVIISAALLIVIASYALFRKGKEEN